MDSNCIIFHSYTLPGEMRVYHASLYSTFYVSLLATVLFLRNLRSKLCTAYIYEFHLDKRIGLR